MVSEAQVLVHAPEPFLPKEGKANEQRRAYRGKDRMTNDVYLRETFFESHVT